MILNIVSINVYDLEGCTKTERYCDVCISKLTTTQLTPHTSTTAWTPARRGESSSVCIQKGMFALTLIE
jgi:hypothetical protein